MFGSEARKCRRAESEKGRRPISGAERLYDFIGFRLSRQRRIRRENRKEVFGFSP